VVRYSFGWRCPANGSRPRASFNREGLTIFAHAETDDDLADHTKHVIWFGPSEPLDLSIFG
jgi:aromatic ring-cleaving dioxygenase